MQYRPARTKQRKNWRPLLYGLFTLLLIGAVGSYSYFALTRPLPQLEATLTEAPKRTPTALTIAWPEAPMAAVGVLGKGILETHGEQKPAPIASVAKVITARALLNAKPITTGTQGQTYTITQADVDRYNDYKAKGGSVTQVELGEQITEYQMLQAMLLPSSNNLADTAAIWAYGSLDAYATATSKLLLNFGANHTHIGIDASGFSPTTTSTADDLIKIGDWALNEPAIQEIVSQPTADLPVAGTVRNVNWLLGDNGIEGIKTGNTDEAGGVYLFSAVYSVAGSDQFTIIGSVVGATNLSAAMSGARSMLLSVRPGFSTQTAVTAGQTMGTYHAPWGEVVNARATQSLTALAWRSVPFIQPIPFFLPVSAPQSAGSQVGVVDITEHNQQSPIKLDHSIAKPSIWWRLTHGFKVQY